MLGAALARRSDRLLALSTPAFLPARCAGRIRIFTSAVGSGDRGVAVDRQRRPGSRRTCRWWTSPPGEFPHGLPLSILPVAFAAHRRPHGLARGGRDARPPPRRLAASRFRSSLALPSASAESWALIPSLAVIARGHGVRDANVCGHGRRGAPAFLGDGTPANAVPGEAYRLTTSPMLPAVPLFALGGYLLAEGGASQRLTAPVHRAVRVDAWRARHRDDRRARVLHASDWRFGRHDSIDGRVLLPVLVGARYRNQRRSGW